MRNTLACSTLLAIIALPSPALAINEALDVFDYSTRNQGAGSFDVRTSIKTDLALRTIKEGKAVLIVSRYSKENNTCMSSAGLTSPVERWHTPRIPNYTAATLVLADKSKPDYEDACLEKSIKLAISKLNTYDHNKLIQETSFTQPLGGIRQEKPERKTINFITFGIKGEDLPVQDFYAKRFETAFDYRNVSVVFDASSWNNATGVTCGVFVGITATPPSGRNPFMPAAYEFASAASATESDCKRVAGQTAAKKLLAKPFTEQGLLRDFERTRELNVATPSSLSVSFALQKTSGNGSSGAGGSSSSTKSSAVEPCPPKCSGAECEVKPKTFSDNKAPAETADCKKQTGTKP